ncbi:MAG: hypothetical protein ACRCST_04855 [Turicibacter sp.]
MYDYPTTLIYDSLPETILLLQSTLPDSMGKKREMLGDLFARGTHVKIKKVKEAGHLIHWDQPDEVIHELLNWFE